MKRSTPHLPRVPEHRRPDAVRATTDTPPQPAQSALIALQQLAGNHAVADMLTRGGQPLEPDTRAQMESTFGESFADVHVHIDDAGDAAAREHAARAVTHGSDVAFREGEYEPHTVVGQRLLAHELAHVVQQRRGGNAPASPATGASSALESGARAAADAVTVGAPVSVSGASAPGIAADTFQDEVAKQLGLTPKDPPATPSKPAYLGPKLAPDQEWAAAALGLDVHAPKKELAPIKLPQFSKLVPPLPAAGPTKAAASADAAEKARWKGIPPQLKPMLDQLHVAPEAWKQMVGDLATLAPDAFRFQYKIDEKLYDQMKSVVSDAYRDPANFTPLPPDIDGPLHTAFGVAPTDLIPQARLDVLAQEAASMTSTAFRKKYNFTQDQTTSLNRWLNRSNHAVPQVTDPKVIAFDGTIHNESDYEDYMMRKRIEAIHVPSGTGAVASAVTRIFTDDERIIGAVGAVGDLAEIGAAGFAARPHEEVRPTGGPIPISATPRIKGGPNERFVPNAPRPPLPASGEWTPPPTQAATAAEPRVPAVINEAPKVPETPAVVEVPPPVSVRPPASARPPATGTPTAETPPPSKAPPVAEVESTPPKPIAVPDREAPVVAKASEPPAPAGAKPAPTPAAKAPGISAPGGPAPAAKTAEMKLAELESQRASYQSELEDVTRELGKKSGKVGQLSGQVKAAKGEARDKLNQELERARAEKADLQDRFARVSTQKNQVHEEINAINKAAGRSPQQAGRDFEVESIASHGMPKNEGKHQTSFPGSDSPDGNRVPDHMPKADGKGGWTTARTPAEAEFIADSKLLDKSVTLTPQVKGFIELAGQSKQKVLLLLTAPGATISPTVQEFADTYHVSIHQMTRTPGP